MRGLSLYPNSKVNLPIYLVFLILICAVLNPVLRYTPESPWTAFRILAPFAVLFIFQIWGKGLGVLTLFLSLFTYNYLVSLIGSHDSSMSMIYLLNYLYLFLIYYLMDFLFSNYDLEKVSLYILNLFRFSCLTFYILFFLKLFFKINLTWNYDQSFYINTVFRTPNDLALVLGLFVVFLVNSSQFSLLEKVFHLSAILYINFYNDAKASILSVALCVFTYICILWFKNRLARKLKISFSVIAMVGIVTIFVLTRHLNISFKDGNISLFDLFLDPIKHIVNLEPYHLRGSIYDRTDAAIYGLVEFFKTFGLGLSAGGSIEVLSQPSTMTMTGRSLHNFLLEWIVELGWYSMLVFAFILATFFRALKDINSPEAQRVILFTLALPLFSVSQSSGYISNYLFWIGVFYIYIVFYKTSKLESRNV